MRVRQFVAMVCLMLVGACSTASLAADASIATAAERKDFSSIAGLIRQKADVNASQLDGMTALHWAVQHSNGTAVDLLIAAGANVSAANRYGVTPLAIGCQRGNAAIVEALLRAGANPNTVLPGGETALMTASRTGVAGPIRSLIARGADVNASEPKGQTALMWAAAEGNREAVDLLLAAGADWKAELASGFTAIFFAVREGKSDVVFRLLEAGADVNAVMQPERRNGSTRGRPTTALLLAVENGHFELAVALLKAGADANAHPAGFTALHAVTGVRRPLRGDGDPSPDGSGNLDSLDFVRHIVVHGANVNAQHEKGESGKAVFGTKGSTPFVMAARNSDLALLRLLLELGADPHIPNADGCTPLLAAAGVGALGSGDELAGAEEEAIETVQWLVEQQGADVNTVDRNGETAVHGATYQERSKLVQFLVDHGAKIDVWNRKNKWGWTPIMIAHGHRPGNFRPSPHTIAALEKVMRASGVEPPKPKREVNQAAY